MSTTETLNRMIGSFQFEQDIDLVFEAEAAWFPKGQQAAEPYLSTEEGEAQAVVVINGKRYCVSLEEIP